MVFSVTLVFLIFKWISGYVYLYVLFKSDIWIFMSTLKWINGPFYPQLYPSDRGSPPGGGLLAGRVDYPSFAGYTANS